MESTKLLFVFILLIPQLCVFSQAILLPEMMPLVDDTLFYKKIDNYSGDVESTGEDYLWNFSDINATNWTADTFVSVSSTPFAYNISFNNPTAPKYKATLASPQPDINIPVGGFSFSNIFYYYKLSGDTLYSQVGQAVTVNSIPLPIRFDDIDYLYHFPSSFGDYDTCFSSYSVSIPQIGFNSRRQTRYNYYDGYGTLITPVDTFYDVIRVKTIIKSRDSIYSEQYNMPFAFNTTTTEYKWFTSELRGPAMILSNTSGQGPSRTSLKYQETPITIPENILSFEKETILVYPNPFSESVIIKISTNLFPCKISVQDELGQVIYQKSCLNQVDLLNISHQLLNLKSGFYFLQFSTQKSNLIRKIIKK